MVPNYVQLREQMVKEQLIKRGIRDSRVLQAMTEIPRHLFVPREIWERAYEDRALPIGASQTISQPYMVARMIEALELTGSERVLEVGTGSGYAAAVLSRVCARVYSVEMLEDLALRAQRLLTAMHSDNVSVFVGDGTLGWQEYAPYDAIVVAAAAPGIPLPLMEQLSKPGRLVFPIGEQDLQILVRIRKDESGIYEEYLGECQFVKLRGKYGWE